MMITKCIEGRKLLPGDAVRIIPNPDRKRFQFWKPELVAVRVPDILTEEEQKLAQFEFTQGERTREGIDKMLRSFLE